MDDIKTDIDEEIKMVEYLIEIMEEDLELENNEQTYLMINALQTLIDSYKKEWSKNNKGE